MIISWIFNDQELFLLNPGLWAVKSKLLVCCLCFQWHTNLYVHVNYLYWLLGSSLLKLLLSFPDLRPVHVLDGGKISPDDPLCLFLLSWQEEVPYKQFELAILRLSAFLISNLIRLNPGLCSVNRANVPRRHLYFEKFTTVKRKPSLPLPEIQYQIYISYKLSINCFV